jgi:hypothetical protein
MKSIIAIILMSISLSAIAGSQCAADKTIYYGMNTKHTKEVQVCDLGDKISYQFGAVGKKPEIMLVKNKAEVWKTYTSMGQNEITELYIPNGKHTYNLYNECSACGDSTPAKSAGISVLSNGTPIATIDIDTTTMVENIGGADLPQKEQ